LFGNGADYRFYVKGSFLGDVSVCAKYLPALLYIILGLMWLWTNRGEGDVDGIMAGIVVAKVDWSAL